MDAKTFGAMPANASQGGWIPDEKAGPEWSYGLTKRELFAAMAMQAITSKPVGGNESLLVAPLAVAYADALLAELAKDQS